MKRRVIQIANSTQLVSLPIQWARKLNIKKGDELDVSPDGNKLIVSVDQQPVSKNINLDITGLDSTSILHVIRALYRKGYDQIDLSFKNPFAMHFRKAEKEKVNEIIFKEVSHLTGLEIIRQTDTFCSLRCISEATPKEFETIMRRIFLLLQDLYGEFVQAISKNDLVSLETVEQKHYTISKSISYCIHLLNKYGHPDHTKITFLHHILATMDRITDFVKYSARDILSHQKDLKPETKQMITRIAKSLELYNKFFFEYSPELMSKMNENRDNCKRDMEKLSGKIPYPELHILHKMEQTLDLFLDIEQARVSIEDFK